MYTFVKRLQPHKSKPIHSYKRYVPLRLDSDGIGHVTQMPNVDLSDIDPQELQAAENEYWKQKDKREKRAGEINEIRHKIVSERWKGLSDVHFSFQPFVKIVHPPSLTQRLSVNSICPFPTWTSFFPNQEPKTPFREPSSGRDLRIAPW